jgi:hypothetical protein
MNKKFKATLILASLSWGTGAWAQFSVINNSSSSSSGTTGSPVRSAPGEDNSTTTLPSERTTCSTEKRVSFQMLRNLMVPASDYAISTVDGNARKLKVQIPAHYGDCLDVKFEYKISGNDVLVYAHNDKTYAEYTSCLKEKEILNAEGTQFDASKATISEASFEYIDLPQFDATKNVEAFFMSPNPNPANGNYGAAHASGWLSSSDSCSKRESLQEGGSIVYLSPENEAAERAFRACNSLDYEAILRELERLDESTVGNAAVLRSILEGALDTARQQRGKEIYDRLGEIEKQFKATDEDRAAGRNVGVTEDEAIRLANEYGKLLKELNEVILDPSIGEIDRLVKEYSETTSRARQSEIQDRLKTLNSSVGEYSKRGSKGLRDLYAGLQEYALVDQAEEIEGFRLKSEAFSRVYVGRIDGRRGDPLSIEKANKFVTDRMKTFMTQVVQDWEDSYRVRNLDRAPLNSSQRRVTQAQSAVQRNWQRYQQSEQSQYKKYCSANFIGSVKNPVRCQQFMRGAESRRRRAMAQRERDLKNLKKRGEHYSNLSNQYQSAYDRFQSERESSYDDMGIYGDYGDDYSYLYGSSSDPYDMYDMGGMSMNMGANMPSGRTPAGYGMHQQGQFGAGMYSPMMGQNPYMMNQQQMMTPQMGGQYMFPQQNMGMQTPFSFQ